MKVGRLCSEAVLALFPDICPKRLEKLAVQFDHDHKKVIGHIIDQQDARSPYPKWGEAREEKAVGFSGKED